MVEFPWTTVMTGAGVTEEESVSVVDEDEVSVVLLAEGLLVVEVDATDLDEEEALWVPDLMEIKGV